jgi:hypothetical protein
LNPKTTWFAVHTCYSISKKNLKYKVAILYWLLVFIYLLLCIFLLVKVMLLIYSFNFLTLLFLHFFFFFFFLISDCWTLHITLLICIWSCQVFGLCLLGPPGLSILKDNLVYRKIAWVMNLGICLLIIM